MHDDIIAPRSRKEPVREPAWYLDKAAPVSNSPKQSQPAKDASAAVDPDFADLDSASQPSVGSELQSRVQGILSQPMDRKKFLITAGVAGLGVVGLGQVLRVLQDQSRQASGHRQGNRGGGSAYGSDAYGGTNTTRNQG